MPAVSKAQFRLMKAICKGVYPDGYLNISREVACEFIESQSPEGLPEKKKKFLKKHLNKVKKKDKK